MSRKQRRKRFSRRNKSEPVSRRPEVPSSDRAPLLPGVVFVAGLIVILMAALVVNLTARTTLFWLYRNDYVRTELEVTDLIPGTGDSDSVLIGKVAATGEEIHSNQIPTDLVEFSSLRGVVGTVMRPEAARGKRIPIWYASNHQSFLTSAKLQFVSEFDTLPSGKLVLGITCLNLTLFALGAWCIRFGVRRFPAAPKES